MKKTLLVILLITFLPATGFSETLHISPRTTLHFDVPTGWLWTDDPPQILLAIIAKKIGAEAISREQSPNQLQLLAAARDRLINNEAILYNPQSSAYLTLDLSPLRKGESPPDKEGLKLSVSYTGQVLSQETGVSHLHDSSRKVTIPGIKHAYRYDADYQQHAQKMRFSGIIGFSSPFWLFFYYNDYLNDLADSVKAEQVFNSIRIEHQ